MWLCWPCDRQAPIPGCTLTGPPIPAGTGWIGYLEAWPWLWWLWGPLHSLTISGLQAVPQARARTTDSTAVLLLATRGCSSKWIPISCHVKMSSVTALNVSVNTLNVINSGSKTLMTRDQKARTSECDYVCLLYTVCGLFLCRQSSRAAIMTEKHSRFPSRLNVSILGV